MISQSLKPHPFAPRLRRLPKGKPMTLVAAFRCVKGGIMLCADQEENDGFARREVDKIYKFNLLSAQIFIAGSGPSAMVTKVQAEIGETLLKANWEGEDIQRGHKDVIEQCLRSFHKQYAANLKGGFLDLVIIVAPLDPKYAPMMYRTELAALIPEPLYYATGTGKTICDYFADRLYEYGRLDKDSMKIVGAFILREAEKSAAGVGMGADIQFIHEGDKSVHYLSPEVVKKLQDLIPPIQESIWDDWKVKVKIPESLLG
jgi:20S proteasome alpha/beta subunit